MSAQPISFSITAPQYEALAKRAGVLNIRPAEYAKRLFDAAYFVRCRAEKGEAVFDQELDCQVRQVFLLADCEPEYIAQAIGMLIERVQRILAAWRGAAKNMASDGGAVAAVTGKAQLAGADSAEPSPSVPPAPSGERNPRSIKAWPTEVVERAAALWADGKTAVEIAEAIGKKRGAVEMFASKNRDIFPKRKRA